MKTVEARDLSKHYSVVKAVDRISFTARAGSFVVILGPSGCGKSTILRMVAGLEEPTSGEVIIGGESVNRQDPSRRGVSMVFQSYALFPHLTVAENIIFGLKVRKVSSKERAARLKQVAAKVGLEEHLDRKPGQLSGGQRQRVALARAIIAQRPVCLMDEPLSNLDAKLRHQMRMELKRLQKELGMTVLYVTHDQTEAMSMADHIVLVNQGGLEQQGTPEDIYYAPASTFVARFIGTPPMNLLPLEPMLRAMPALAGQVETKGDCAGAVLGIRPEDLALREKGLGLEVMVSSEDYHGADNVVGVRPANWELADKEKEIAVRMAGRVRPAPGTRMFLSWSGREALHMFDSKGKRQDSFVRKEPCPLECGRVGSLS